MCFTLIKCWVDFSTGTLNLVVSELTGIFCRCDINKTGDNDKNCKTNCYSTPYLVHICIGKLTYYCSYRTIFKDRSIATVPCRYYRGIIVHVSNSDLQSCVVYPVIWPINLKALSMFIISWFHKIYRYKCNTDRHAGLKKNIPCARIHSMFVVQLVFRKLTWHNPLRRKLNICNTI